MTRLGDYELLTKIATGGMAEIHVARRGPGGAGDVCVVKRLLPQHAQNEEFIQMFLEEGRIATRLHHPNVVHVHDYGSEAGAPYLAMEHLHGEDLRTVLRALRARGTRMPLPLALYVMRAVCAGLHHAHEARDDAGRPLGIVHRDVSPHNVFLTFDGIVKIVDFGIAKSRGRRWETRHGTLKGKVPYMAPEQIRAGVLDRRTDVYATGVLLYELVVGKRPYVLTTTGDFAMMVAIARHDVCAPRTVDPDISPALEQIVLSALGYEPRSRPATADALRATIDAFAQAEQLVASAADLRDLLADLFPERFEEWRDARRSSGELAVYTAKVEQARARASHDDEPLEDAPGSVATEPGVVAPTSGAVASVVEVLGVTIVSLHGRIDESFEGRALGESLSGTVVIDAAGVERVTSYGVREWLAMMEAIDARGSAGAHLARCPEAIVNQLGLVRSFAGDAQIASFFVPLLCRDCGETFSVLLDVERDAEDVAILDRLTRSCPRCGGEAKLDDDPAYFAFATPLAGRAAEERVRLVLDQLGELEDGAVQKTVTATETRIKFERPVDASFRWRRVLDGVEGSVVIDLRGAPRLGPEASAGLARALASLGGEVTRCELVECPPNVAMAVARAVRMPACVRIVSFALAGACPSCGASRTGIVERHALERSLIGEALLVPCRRCNAPLVLESPPPAVALLGHALAPAPAPVAPATSSVDGIALAEEPLRRDAPRSRRSRAARHAGALLLGVSLAAALVVAVAAAKRVRAHAPSGAAEVPSGAAVDVAEAPEVRASAGDETPSPRRESVRAGVSASGPTAEVAASTARARAVDAILAKLFAEIDADVRAANDAGSSGTPSHDAASSAARRFAEQLGPLVGPDRVSVETRTDDGGVTVDAVYEVPGAAWEHAVSYYSAVVVVGGITFARAFPSRGDGVLVVSSTDRGAARGSLLSRVDGRPATLEHLATLATGAHLVVVEHGGRVRETLLFDHSGPER